MKRQEQKPETSVRLRIFGRIQGVGFRYWAAHEAVRLRVTGWIRNEADGTVSCECQGQAGAVNAFVEALRGGPPGARVDKLEINTAPAGTAWRRFEIR